MGKNQQNVVVFGGNKTGDGKINKLLKDLYYNIENPSAYSSAVPVYRAAKKEIPNIKLRDVKQWLRKQLTTTLHKPIRKNFVRNRVIVKGIDDQWQLDLCDMKSKAKWNDNFMFILTCIDCFSKYAWAVAMKNKSGNETVRVLQQIFLDGRIPKRLQTDKGTEFLNEKVQKFLRERNVKLFTTESDKKASIVERFNRTLKTRMFKYFTAQNTYRYIDVLPELVDGYNNSKHRSIKMKPIDVRSNHEITLRRRLYPKLSRKNEKYKFDINDLVRITKSRQTFQRGYLPNWSEEIFQVHQRSIKQYRPVYFLRDFHGETIKGAFYSDELQLVTEPDEYRIERIIKTQHTTDGRQKHLVKWKGWPEKFNSWVWQDNLHSL